MKNSIIIFGALVLISTGLFAQNNPSRNYKIPVQDREVAKNQKIAINKRNVIFTNSFEAPQNYKHGVFAKKEELLVINNKTEKQEVGSNLLFSNRNYKSYKWAKNL